jgi:hypothetical protein
MKTQTLDEYREQARRLIHGDAVSERPATDNRPRYRSGRLKDPFDRLSEELDFEELEDPILGRAYFEAHRDELKHYAAMLAERQKKTTAEESIEAGGTQTEFEAPGRREAIAAQERRAQLEGRIRELEAQLAQTSAPEKGESQ